MIPESRDITERKRIEQDLRASENRLALAMECTGLGLWDHDLRTDQVERNDNWMAMLGYEPDEIGPNLESYRGLMHPDDVPHFEKCAAAHESGQTPVFSVEHRMRAKSGEWRWIHNFGRIVRRDERGHPLRALGVHLDITDRKRAEEALRESEAILNETGTIARIGGWRHDLATGEATWTQALYELIEIESGAPPGVDEHLEYYPVTDREILDRAYRESVEKGTPFDLELRANTAKGRQFWCRAIGRPIFQDGKCVEVRGTFQDIDAKKHVEMQLRQSEAALNEAQRIAGIGTFVWSIADDSLEWSDSMHSLAGVNPNRFEGTLADAMVEFIHPDDRQQVQQQIDDMVAQGRTWPMEYRFLRPDGQTRLFRSGSRFLFDEGGQLVGCVGVQHDITERKDLEEQLRHTQKMEAVGQLAAGVAHEFNNLMFGVLGCAELILTTTEDELPEYFERPLRDIQKCGRRGAALTKQLLSFARKKKPEVSQFDLSEVVRGLESVVKQMITAAIKLEVDLASDLPPVETDRGEIEQALLNLAGNARDAMPDGGALTIRTATTQVDEARVSGHPHARPGAYVQLSVADTGCGMAPETTERIFEPFFTTKPVGEGTGLGLSTVFADVTKCGGIVKVESRPGEGSVFHVYLPVAEQEVEAASDDATRPATQLPAGGQTILLVDDDEIVLDSGACLLEMRGYNVIRAAGAPEALKAAATHDGPIDLLLTDVTMPEMNGRELSQKLAEQRPDMKVIFMSGYAQDVLDAGAAKGEHIEFLEKPPEGDALLRRIRDVLDAPRNSGP